MHKALGKTYWLVASNDFALGIIHDDDDDDYNDEDDKDIPTCNLIIDQQK